MKKRKFISFTDKELDILEDALEEYGDLNLLNLLNEEKREREYNIKRYDEWRKNKTKIYCC